MTAVNQTGQVGVARGPAREPVDRRLSPERRPSEGTQTEYIGIENDRNVAGSADVRRPQEFLIRQSLDLHERLKERLADLESVLLKTTDAKTVRGAKEKGLIHFSVNEVARLKREGLLPQAAEIEGVLQKVTEAKEALETDISHSGPQDLSKARTDLATVKLESYLGTELPDEIKGDPLKVRELVVGSLRKKLEAVAARRKEILKEIHRTEEVKRTGSPEEKARADEALKRLRVELKGFEEGERLYSQGIVSAERWVLELEKGEVEKDLELSEEEFGEEEVRWGEPPRADKEDLLEGEAKVGISSVGGETDYEGGASDYVDLSSAEAASGQEPKLDLTGTQMAVTASSGRVKEDIRKTRRIVQQLLKRLLSGDYRALDLALIMLAKQAQGTTIQIGAKMIKALDQLDRHQQGIVDQLGKMDTTDKNFSSKTASLNIQANRIASDRTAITNLLRDVLASMEEVQNITKSFLDIQGAQVRHLSRFNT